MEEKNEIKTLTEERKKIEKRIKKLNRKNAVLNFLLKEVKFSDYKSYKNTSLYQLIGGGLSLILMLIVNLLNLSLFMTILGFGLSLAPLVASIASYGALLIAFDKNKDKLSELMEERQELLKHLDCVRTGENYIAPEPKPSKDESYIALVNSFYNATIKAQEEKRQNLLEKARLRHIDVDRIKRGPSAFESKAEYKEAKQDFKNFLEENDVNDEEIRNIID